MSTSADILFAIVLVVAAVAPASVAVAQESIYEADTGHELATNESIAEFENESVVSGDIHGLNMSLTVADDADDAGLNDWITRSTGRVFLRVDYNEELDRTVRFYLPQEYASPQLKQGGDIVHDVTGFSMPSLTDDGTEWHYISPQELEDNETDYITSNATTIQYDTNTGSDAAEANWVPVPDCDGGTDTICTYSKADHPDRAYLLSTSGDPPRVRYREGSSVTGELDTAINDALNGVDNLAEDAFSLFGESDDDGGD